MNVAPARGLALSRLLGTWKIARSSYAFWRPTLGHVRTDAEVTYAPLPSKEGIARWSDTLRYRAPAWIMPNGPRRPRAILGVDALDAHEPGKFAWRGLGVLGVLRNAWTVVAFDPAYAWIVTYVAPSTFGAAAIDLYVRDLDSALDAPAILASACTSDVLRRAAAGMRTLPRSA